MQADPEVSRRKFEKELARLEAQRQLLARRRIFVSSADFPRMNVLFVPDKPLLIPVVEESRGPGQPPRLLNAPVISLSARPFEAAIDLTDYDLRAPSVEFVDPVSHDPLPFEHMFRALEFDKHRGTHVVLLGDHPTTHKPFLCVRGTREYHEHPQHTGDDWLLYRSSFNVFSLLMSIWRVCVDLPSPQLMFQPEGMRVNWVLTKEKL